MKKIILFLTVGSLMLSFVSCGTSGLGLNNGGLSGLAGATNNSSSQATSSPSGSNTGGLGDFLSSVAGALGLAGNLKMDDLVGTWSYYKPAVEFKSDNFLMKAGGLAASQTVESKLSTYYKSFGFDNMVMTVNEDYTFNMKLKIGSLGGTITQSDDKKQLFFNFTLLNSISLGKVEAFVTKKSSSEISITYDVTGLLAIMEKVGALSGNSSISAITSLLNQYDGMTAGFDLKKKK